MSNLSDLNIVDSLAGTVVWSHTPEDPATRPSTPSEREASPHVETSPLNTEMRLTECQIRAFQDFKTQCQPWFNGFKTPEVLRNNRTGLPRSILVIPDAEAPSKVYILLKRKMGDETSVDKQQLELGRGCYKTATLAIDVDTGEKKTFLAEYATSKGRIPDKEAIALRKFSDKERVLGGIDVRYSWKSAFSQNTDKLGFLVDFCDGGDLQDYLFKDKVLPKRRLLSPSENLQVAYDITFGLAEIHEEGYVHRDIKPANILLSYESGKLRAKIGDLGFTAPSQIVQQENIKGTPGFLDPFTYFQRRIHKKSFPLDRRSDIWSLGVTLWEMNNADKDSCSKTMKYRAGKVNNLWPGGSVVQDPTQSLKTWKEAFLLDRDKEGTMDFIIDKCLQFNPEERWTAPQVREALKKLLP